jgi:hypothetical protein
VLCFPITAECQSRKATINTNQAPTPVTKGDAFTCAYTTLSALKTHYVKACVANKECYATGQDIAVKGVTFDISLIPCHLAVFPLAFTGPFSLTDAYTYFDPLTQSGTGCNFFAYTNSHQISYQLSRVPAAGVYTTTEADHPPTNNVIIAFDGVIAKAGPVYICRRSTPPRRR